MYLYLRVSSSSRPSNTENEKEEEEEELTPQILLTRKIVGCCIGLQNRTVQKIVP